MIKLAYFFVVIFLIFGANLVLAQDQLGGLSDTAGAIGYEQADGAANVAIASKVGLIIDVILSLIGVVFFVLVMIGGFDILGANGNQQLIVAGKERIKKGFIGMLVVFAAYLITVTMLRLIQGNLFDITF